MIQSNEINHGKYRTQITDVIFKKLASGIKNFLRQFNELAFYLMLFFYFAKLEKIVKLPDCSPYKKKSK